ncbi:hypothetical protein [Chitinolyticbacter albus]|uniref:hypothetical protein n=1 Tax=Chitinolyticbacter albus TaxID=2961951 RepID=UPI00210A1E5D|nr:hypothetical protein [Chitinolyticbacter albus]
MIADTGLPTRREELQVDRHTSSTQYERVGDRHGTQADTSYTLHFTGGRLSSCSVGYSAYGRVEDGETVSIRSTRLLKTCIRVSKGDEVIHENKFWRIFGFFFGCLLIGVAFRWLEHNEDGIQISIR